MGKDILKKVDSFILTENNIHNIRFPLCERDPMEVKSVDLYIKGSKARNAVNGKIIDNYEFNVLIPSHRIYTGCSGVAWADVIIDNKWLFTDRASNIMMLLLKCGITDGLINEKCTFAKRVNSFVVVPKRLIDDLDIQDILE